MPDSSSPLSAKNPVGIAVIGGGTVGGGVVRLLREQRESIARRCGRELRVTHIVKRDLSNIAHLGEDAKPLLTDDWRAAVAAEDADIVVELMGGENEAAECIRAAAAAGKPVVTANKALLAAAADGEFPKVAHEAAIAGCIPVVKILREALAADHVQEIAGVINGTCNYILTAMETEQMPFVDALRRAQQLGYAEAEPALDIDGMDAAHKLVLLARLAFGAKISMADVPVIGVRDFDRRDIEYAEQFDFRVKLLASAKRAGDTLQVGVRPALIPKHHPLAAVEGATNAVVIRSAFAGETMHTGAGAGAEPTAVAVVADIIDIVRNGETTSPPPPPMPPVPTSLFSAPHYLRLRVTDQSGVLADITRIIAAQKISIEAIHQNESLPGKIVDVVILLHNGGNDKVAAAVASIAKLPAVQPPVVVMPIEKLGG